MLFVTCYSLVTGNPSWLSHPTNSAGEICGQGKHSGKPYLLYFDLTQCASIRANIGSCSTTQICVQECPRTYWSFAQGKCSGIKHFCENVTLNQLENTSFSQLVTEKFCPVYVLPSKPVLGRCVPAFAFGRREDNVTVDDAVTQEKLSVIKTEDGDVVNVDNILEGVEYLIDSFDNGPEKKILYDTLYFWWIILISYWLSLGLSLCWSFLIKLCIKPFIWKSLGLTFGFLLAGSIFPIFVFLQLQSDDEKIPWVLSRVSTFWYNNYTLPVCISMIAASTLSFLWVCVYFFKHIKHAIKIIQLVLVIALLQSLVQVLLIICALATASYLATSGPIVNRVVNACSTETCFNNNTGEMFAVHDRCDMGTFGDCSGCPTAQCVYHSIELSYLASFVQICILLGLFWLHVFTRTFGSMVIAGVFINRYWKPAQSSEGVWISVHEICQFYLKTEVPWMIGNSTVFVISIVFGRNFCDARRRSILLLSRNSEKERTTYKTTKVIIFSGKLFIVGCMSIISFILYLVIFSTNEFLFVNEFVPSLFCLLGYFFILFNLLNVFDVAINAMFLSNTQNHENYINMKIFEERSSFITLW